MCQEKHGKRGSRMNWQLFYGYLVTLCVFCTGHTNVHSFSGYSNVNHQLVIIIWDKTDTPIEWWRWGAIIEQFALALFTLPLVSSDALIVPLAICSIQKEQHHRRWRCWSPVLLQKDHWMSAHERRLWKEVVQECSLPPVVGLLLHRAMTNWWRDRRGRQEELCG